MTARIAVLASGGGSNLQALLDYLRRTPDPGAAVVYVASDRPEARALARSRDAGIEAEALSADVRTSGLASRLAARDIDVVALAGYLRMLPPGVTTGWRGRVVNVHPSLLPAFGGAGMYGHHVHEAVLRRGVRVSGASVHFVDEQYDNGPIIAQWPVPVLPGDGVESLASRVLAVEHLLYPPVVTAVATGRVRLSSDGQVTVDVPLGWDATLPQQTPPPNLR
ncbi:MAG: phosphoribosylglycinamide formyltransferase [Gemmatimonadota bacterium]